MLEVRMGWGCSDYCEIRIAERAAPRPEEGVPAGWEDLRISETDEIARVQVDNPAQLRRYIA